MLPTEAQWEYACRAGSKTRFGFGDQDKLRQYGWFGANAGQKTHPAGEKKPNRWGLCDLYGNVSEWCEDVYSPTYYKDSPMDNPHGPPNPGKDGKRVIRGGSWKSSPEAVPSLRPARAKRQATATPVSPPTTAACAVSGGRRRRSWGA